MFNRVLVVLFFSLLFIWEGVAMHNQASKIIGLIGLVYLMISALRRVEWVEYGPDWTEEKRQIN